MRIGKRRRDECSPHQWIRNWRWERTAVVDLCRNCDTKRRTSTIRCPRCLERPIADGFDPHCYICDGRGRFRPRHACICCGTQGLAAGAAMCRECLWEHGFKGGHCSRETRDEQAHSAAVAAVDAQAHKLTGDPNSRARRIARDLS